jgi:hypothetical protein
MSGATPPRFDEIIAKDFLCANPDASPLDHALRVGIPDGLPSSSSSPIVLN